MRRRVAGPDDLDTIRTLNNLASALEYQKKYEEAAAMFEEAAQGLGRTQGPDHPDTLLVLTNVASSKARAGDAAGGIPILEAALEGQRRVLGPTHPDTLYTQIDLGEMLRRDNRFADAEAQIVSALHAITAELGATHVLAFRSMGALKRLYVATGEAPKLHTIEARRLAALSEKAQAAGAGAADKRSYAYVALTLEPEELREPARALEMALAADALAGGSDPEIQYVVALAWLRHGDLTKAEAAIRRALELLPADAPDRAQYEKLKEEVLAR